MQKKEYLVCINSLKAKTEEKHILKWYVCSLVRKYIFNRKSRKTLSWCSVLLSLTSFCGSLCPSLLFPPYFLPLPCLFFPPSFLYNSPVSSFVPRTLCFFLLPALSCQLPRPPLPPDFLS